MASARVAIIGAGNVGGGLGKRLANAGVEVKFGIKPDADVKDLLAAAKGASAASASDAAAWGDVVFLAVPGAVTLEVARSLAKELDGKIVVDCNNILKWDNGPVWTPPPEGSLSQAIAKAVPGARVIKAFNQFGAEFHADPSLPGGGVAQVFIAGDDADAKKTVAAIAERGGFRAVDAGPLRNAGLLENLAILWIHLSSVGGQGRNFAFGMQHR